MNPIENAPVYDLEERTYKFAKRVRIWVKTLPNTITNTEDSKQLIRASGSVGANYIETNESLSKKDFSFRVKICLKEAKESIYWLRLISETNFNLREETATRSNRTEKNIFSYCRKNSLTFDFLKIKYWSII